MKLDRSQMRITNVLSSESKERMNLEENKVTKETGSLIHSEERSTQDGQV